VYLRRGDPTVWRGLLHDDAIQQIGQLPHVYLQDGF
jgi:hypothetical protein